MPQVRPSAVDLMDGARLSMRLNSSVLHAGAIGGAVTGEEGMRRVYEKEQDTQRKKAAVTSSS